MPDGGRVTCAGCGLLCDDVTLEVGRRRALPPPLRPRRPVVLRARRRDGDAPAATIDGRPAEVEAALARAAELLRGARRPLLHGFAGATVEDARAAVALADRLGAIVATDGLGGAWPGAPRVPLRGASTATLGEIRDRSRVVVVWREDPMTTHPRLLERLGFGDARTPGSAPSARWSWSTTATRRPRSSPTCGCGCPGARPRGAELAARAAARAAPARAGDAENRAARAAAPHQRRPPRRVRVRARPDPGAGGQRRALALHELVRELSHGRHVVTLALPARRRDRGAPGRARVADRVLRQRGPRQRSPGADQARHARSRTTRRSTWCCASRTTRRPPAAATQIAFCSVPGPGAEVSIRTAAAGVAAAGTAHRLDGTPLTLQAPLPDDAPTAAALLTRLLAEVATRDSDPDHRRRDSRPRQRRRRRGPRPVPRRTARWSPRWAPTPAGSTPAGWS